MKYIFINTITSDTRGCTLFMDDAGKEAFETEGETSIQGSNVLANVMGSLKRRY